MGRKREIENQNGSEWTELRAYRINSSLKWTERGNNAVSKSLPLERFFSFGLISLLLVIAAGTIPEAVDAKSGATKKIKVLVDPNA